MAGKLDAIFLAVEKSGKLVNAALSLFNIAEPVLTGVIRGVKALQNKDGSVDYIIVLQAGQAELDAADSKADEALALIDAELRRLGEIAALDADEPPVDSGG